MAVKCHPDKGGDKQQFQALQDAYQEVLKKKKALDIERESLNQASQEAGLDSSNAKHKAERIAEDIHKQIQKIKDTAKECAQLAQLTLYWQKVVENAARPALSSAFLQECMSQGCKSACEEEAYGIFKGGADKDRTELPKTVGG